MKNIIKNRSRKTMKNNTNLKKYKIAKNNRNKNIMSGGGNNNYVEGTTGSPGITKRSWFNKLRSKLFKSKQFVFCHIFCYLI